MRLGCVGCFLVIVVVLAAIVVVGGVLFLSSNIFGTPDLRPVSYSKADGYAAQQKLYEIAQRQAGRSSRKDPVVLSEREVNAFLAHHLTEVAGVSVASLTVKLSKGQFFAQGQTTLRYLLSAPAFSYIFRYMPESRLNQPVWVTVRGRLSIEDGAGGNSRNGSVAVTELVLGRQPLHSLLLYGVLGPSGGGLFRWPVPRVVESVQLEEGQAIIHTR